MIGTIINLNQVTRIRIYYKKINSNMRYRNKPFEFCDLISKIFGQFKPYYNLLHYQNYTLKEIDKWCVSNNCYIENNIIYYFPHLKIFQSDGTCIERYYNNEDEVDLEIENIKRKIPNTIIY